MNGLTKIQSTAKRSLDVVVALSVLAIGAPLILIGVLLATIDTGRFGIFSQSRVGRYGLPFRIYKLRTMRPCMSTSTNVTVAADPRITRLGAFLRASKLDELPQFINVLLGQMSVVGPRPDVPGYADNLTGEARTVLLLRPGLTGPASIYFRDEERLLMGRNDPEQFNDEVLWPAKVRLNMQYIANYSFTEDLKLIIDTIFPSLRCSSSARRRADAEKACEDIFCGVNEKC